MSVSRHHQLAGVSLGHQSALVDGVTVETAVRGELHQLQSDSQTLHHYYQAQRGGLSLVQINPDTLL